MATTYQTVAAYRIPPAHNPGVPAAGTTRV